LRTGENIFRTGEIILRADEIILRAFLKSVRRVAVFI
jgi:hypothetical protein